MDVKSNRRFYQIVQDPKNDNAVWLQRKESNPASILFDYHNNCLERNESTLEIHESSLKMIESSKTNCISQGKSETFITEDYEYDGKEESTLCCESNIHYPEWKDSQIYVWHISPWWTRIKQRGYSRQESRNYENIGMVSGFCPNSTRNATIQLSFGKLCQVGTLGIAEWMSEEIQKQDCNYVYAKYEHKNGSDGHMFNMSEDSERNESEGLGRSVSMVVDTFVDESIRHNIAASIYITLVDSKDLETLNYFYEFVAEFGFEHIIVIGEIQYGMLFLDCYGRVFKWDETRQVLWPLGNSLEEVESKLKSNQRLDQIVWTARYDGVMFYTLPDYNSEQARKTRAVKSVKNKSLKKNKRKKK